MNDQAFEKMIDQKRKKASKPGYGARCATKARAAKVHGSKQELILS